ncbi:protein RRP5 homolog isoform X1 [Megalops cyprinoides]|uniref:protein RRP5 homolog isoform X1 n=1 Tax=Megalops cyprinoides TaxID=118141 RepID=UPI0018649FA1|nr:protein RRP5 homolog isoform X1 [Megalops cyprinoides]
MTSMEDDFPRGGTAKKPSGSKPVKQHVEVDNLFETREPEDKKKRKLTKKGDEKKTKKQKTGKEDTLKLNATTSVDILHLKSLKVGTLLLGCVREVTDFEVTVSLPSGLTGFLRVANVSESYTKVLSEQLDSDLEEIVSLPNLFSPGMLLRCAVSSLGTTKEGHVSLQLSVNPKEVNKGLSAGSLKAGMMLSGCVESIEDHGFLVDIGLSGTKAFLPKQKAKDSKQAELKVGQYVNCLLEEVKNEGRIVRLSVNPSAIAQAFAETQHGWTLSSLLPGLLVKAQIKKVTPHGLILEFLSSFTGSVDFLHMDADKKSNYSVGDNVKACVLYVEPSTRTVGLSLRSHLLQPGGILEPVVSERVGEVAKDCKMTSMHHLSGATLELPDETPVFAHKNHLKEPKESLNVNRVMARPAHDCRIMDFSPLEQIHLVSLRKSIIEAPFLRYQDLQVGQVVEGTVTALQNFGMLVKVTDHIKGMVPRTHLADIVLKNPEKKYSVGNKVKCRVLSVDPQMRKLVMTRKKALVESTLPLFRSYADARAGRISHGFIVCVKDFGCIVRFYGNVKGLVPKHELSTEPVVVPEKLFYVGQVVKAKVLTCDADQEKLLLSFKAVAGGETETPQQPQFSFEVGKNVDATIVSKVLNGLEVSILPEEMPALLPMTHLSDHVSNCALLWEALKEGDIVSNAVCLTKKKQNITLTKKPLVKDALEDGVVAREFSEIQVGMQLTGWIKNIMPYGVFVEFPFGLVGLAPKSAMSDKFISNTNVPFQMGQTVLAKVTNLDEEKQRFLVTLKVSEVSSEEAHSQGRLAQGLQERKAVTQMIASREDSELLQFLSTLTLGHKLKVTVDEVKEDGTATFVADQHKGATISATKHHMAGVTVTPGQMVTAVVLHVDFPSSQIHVSLAPRLVAKKKTLEADSKLSAVVEYVDQDFAVISLGETSQLTLIHTTSHLNEFRFESEKLSVGKTLTVTVKEPSCEDLGGLPLVSWGSAAPSATKRERKESDSKGPKGPKHTYHHGDTVSGTVKSVRPTSVLVTLDNGVMGSIHVSEIQDVVAAGSFPTSSLKVGSTVTARVIGGKEAHSHKFLPISHPNFTFTIPQLTVVPSKMKEGAKLKQEKTAIKLRSFQAGQEVTCFVSKYDTVKNCLDVTVTPSIDGNVELLAMTLDHKEIKHPEKLFKMGQALNAQVVGLIHSKRLSLSLIGAHSLTPGTRTVGTILKIVPHIGLIVKLPFGKNGCVSVVDLTDSYRPNPLSHYQAGQFVRCCVVGEDDGKLQLSLRPSRTNPDKAPPVKDAEVLSIDDLKEGQLVRGYVKSVGNQGVFIRLSPSITGRAEFQQVTSFFVSDHSLYAKHILPNALYTTKVLRVDKKSGQVDLSLLPEDTGKPDVLPESLGLPLRLKGEAKEKYDSRKRKRAQSESEQDVLAEKDLKRKKKKKGAKSEEDDSGVEVYFREEEDEEAKPQKKESQSNQESRAGPARLQVSGGFSWDLALSALRPATVGLGADSSDGEDEEEQAKPQKKSKKEKELEKRQAEKELSQLESELMDPSQRPQTSGSFERLVLSSPDSSLVWLQYMAFHLQATEIEQARAVAERALKTISFREEQEKLNVWVALLNLENLYGTEESLQKVFERALQYCEPLPVYQQLADIYTESNKHKEAESLYKNMVKRFRQDRAVWLSYGAFLLRQGQSDAAHALLQRAFKSLPDKEHVDLIAKFAQLEFQHGDVERAKSMFDRTLTNYPKRTDLWSVYIDLMVKHGTQKEVRELFDRVIHLSVAVKRIKFFFKRYLEYEKKNGTAETVQAVKEKALEYVEAKGSTASS